MDHHTLPVNLHGDCYYSASRSFLFHCVPKVASRSILKMCRETCSDGWRLVEKGYHDTRFFADYPGELFRFAFIRHPFSRVVSFYYDKFVNYDGSEGKKNMFARMRKLTPASTLKEFIAWLATSAGDDRKADPHYCSQHLFVQTKNGKPAVDFLGRIEQLDTSIEYIWQRLGLPLVELPQLNSNQGAARKHPVNTSEDYMKFLDESDIKILNKRYEADLDLLASANGLVTA